MNPPVKGRPVTERETDHGLLSTGQEPDTLCLFLLQPNSRGGANPPKIIYQRWAVTVSALKPTASSLISSTCAVKQRPLEEAFLC